MNPQARLLTTLMMRPVMRRACGGVSTNGQRISSGRPTEEQYASLEKAGQLAELGEGASLPINEQQGLVRFELPRQAVSLIEVSW